VRVDPLLRVAFDRLHGPFHLVPELLGGGLHAAVAPPRWPSATAPLPGARGRAARYLLNRAVAASPDSIRSFRSSSLFTCHPRTCAGSDRVGCLPGVIGGGKAKACVLGGAPGP
jgi:hypothetical protein